jgi:plasmid stabilization system protein ParE
MTFQVELTPIAEAQIDRTYRWYRERNPDFADRWFRSLMNTIATLQEQPLRCGLAIEHEIFLKKFVNCCMENLKMFIAFYL